MVNINFLKSKQKNKIFCIGLNKTGTTSLGLFFEINGFKVAKQREGELLLKSYLNRDFNEIIKYCAQNQSEVFQDVPFSLPYTYCHLDNAFSTSKFILTVRNSDDEWFNSILKFHSNLYNHGKTPTLESLKNSKYVYEGWSWDLMNEVYFNNEDSIYNINYLKKVYNNYNESVIQYFKNKPGKLIIINLSIEKNFNELCFFLNINSKINIFPRVTSQDIIHGNHSCDFLV